jgi:outer membrane receptor protein involved in Fe transport
MTLLLSALSAFSQTGNLTGRVISSEDKTEIAYAGVKIIGTYLGSLTDEGGKYTIKGIKAGDYSVKFSFIGYADKVFTGIRISSGQTTTLDVQLDPRTNQVDAVTVVGEKNLVDLEEADSKVELKQKDIAEMNVRDVKEIAALQPGVSKSPDGLQVRGARVYETSFLVDNISAQDPLAGTGFGLEVSSASIAKMEIITGGAGAEYGDGSSGVITTRIREGSKELAVAGSWMRDHVDGSRSGVGWNTDVAELSISGPVPFSKKKMTFFNNFSMSLTDDYFGPTAGQLHSSILGNNDSFWAPRQTNQFTHTFKWAYQIKPGTKISVTNQHSLSINQNTRTLQIVGFDAILRPGFQFERSLNLNNATTYTHHSNLTAVNFQKSLSDQLILKVSAGRLFTNLRADANGRPFRSPTVDQLYDEASIVTDPVTLFNPGDQVVFVLPGPGLVNNGGITPVWHDHYAREYTLKASFIHYLKNKKHQLYYGWQQKLNEYQWVDVTRPWVGAPIVINDSTSTESISVGSSNDIWKVRPNNGGLYITDRITYNGIIASLGVRLNYWAPGKFADDAVNNPNAPVIDQIREDYKRNTIKVFGLRYKTRILPKINVSFPVTTNNVMYFNYGHSMRLPHPRFLYAGLDPEYQDRSFLSFIGNPDLNPEVNVSYEVGWKTQITKDLAFTLTAFNNNRFDYIVSRRVIVKDQTGRPVSKTMYINQDYAKIQGVETAVQFRIKEALRTFLNVGYQTARGKSNSARESSLQIEQNGEVPLSTEQFLAWDRPWNINWGVVLKYDSAIHWLPRWTKGLQIYWSHSYQSGFRYTPQELEGYNDLGRPQFVVRNDLYLQERATPWINSDIKISYTWRTNKKGSGVTLNAEVRNLYNNKNAQIINPVTGRAYEAGDNVPNTWRDPRYIGPEERGTPPNDPSRYLAPRQILVGLAFRI